MCGGICGTELGNWITGHAVGRAVFAALSNFVAFNATVIRCWGVAELQFSCFYNLIPRLFHNLQSYDWNRKTSFPNPNPLLYDV